MTKRQSSGTWLLQSFKVLYLDCALTKNEDVWTTKEVVSAAIFIFENTPAEKLVKLAARSSKSHLRNVTPTTTTLKNVLALYFSTVCDINKAKCESVGSKGCLELTTRPFYECDCKAGFSGRYCKGTFPLSADPKIWPSDWLRRIPLNHHFENQSYFNQPWCILF